MKRSSTVFEKSQVTSLKSKQKSHRYFDTILKVVTKTEKVLTNQEFAGNSKKLVNSQA